MWQIIKKKNALNTNYNYLCVSYVNVIGNFQEKVKYNIFK